MKKESLEQQFRDEMLARKTRYYRKQLIWEVVYGVIICALVIATLLIAMAVFAD